MGVVVPGYGPPDAKVMIVGEAPGKQEEAEGRPFVGPSGQLLDEALQAAGIKREECYVTNVVKVRPQSASGANKKPTKKQIKEHLPTLQQEIQSVSPTTILLLGSTAVEAVLQ